MNAKHELTGSLPSKPWYLVPGRVDLTEKRISSKYESDARRQRQWERAHKYFTDCSALVSKLKQWEERSPKPLVDLPPFDTQINSTKVAIDFDSEEVHRVRSELAIQLNQIDELQDQHKKCKEQSNVLIEYVETAREIKSELENELDHQDIKWRRVQHSRSVRDRLVCQVFIIIDKVSLYKSAVQLLEKLANASVLTPCECQEFRFILDEANGLFHTLLTINNSRHLQMTRMFSEEAVRLRDQLASQWKDEETMCFDLSHQIINAFHSILVKKLRQCANEQRELVSYRRKALDDLTKYVSTLQSDTILWSILSDSFSFELSDELDEEEFLTN